LQKGAAFHRFPLSPDRFLSRHPRKVTDMVSQLVRLALEDGRRENGSRHSGPQAKGASAPLKNLVPVK